MQTLLQDPLWRRDLLDALSVEARFITTQRVPQSVDEAKLVQPSEADSIQAVANIRAWRSYLPEACVALMLIDGWQWST